MTAGWAVLIAGCLRAVGNHDVFWHLSAGRRILETGRVPRVDLFSFTRAGRPWVDFEWLSQVLYAGLQNLGGWPALIALKTAALACSAYFVQRTLRRSGLLAHAAAAWLAILSGAWAVSNDVRPENFTLMFFAWLLGELEQGEPSPARTAAVFCLWANLHAAFPAGLAALGLYAADAARRGDKVRFRALALALVAGLAATMLNPFGWRVYAVVVEHLRISGPLASAIVEWFPAGPRNPYHWPFWLLAAAGAGAALSRRLRLVQLSLLALFGTQAALHNRGIPLFAVAAAILAGPVLSQRLDRRRSAAAILAAALFILLLRVPGRAGLVPGTFPERTASFLASQPALAASRWYNPWGWGGYLGWRLERPVFIDGRYLFHELLFEEMQATARPESWQRFLDEHRLDVAVLRRDLPPVPLKRHEPGAKETIEARPYYLFFMPQDRWALVFWDEVSMVFARRNAVDAGWLSRHEYRFFHPDDDPPIERAVAKGALAEIGVRAEACRHLDEAGGDPSAARWCRR